MTFPEDENQPRRMTMHEAFRWLTGDFESEEKPISTAPEPPIPTKHKMYTKPDPSLLEFPRFGVPQDSNWWNRFQHPSFGQGVRYYPGQYVTTTDRVNFPFDKKEPVKKTKREEILEEAAKLITQDRNDQYGPPEENFQNIADAWNIRFKNKLKEPFTAADVAHAMALLKILRDMAGYKEDSAIDAAAYLALYAELSEKETKA